MRTLILTLAALGCAGAPTPAPATPTASRVDVRARLQTNLAADPNAALCQELAQNFEAGDQDALRPHFDHAAFVERVLAERALPPEVAANLRERAPQIEEFARVRHPDGSRFVCLGTRTLRGEPWIALRQWTDTRFDYEFFHLSPNPGDAVHGARIDDTLVVSMGSTSSEANAMHFDPALADTMDVNGEFLQLSYDGAFTQIIQRYQQLPESVRQRPRTFAHFINAVFTTEPTGSPLYDQTLAQMPSVFATLPYTEAYWRYAAAGRSGDAQAREASRAQLLDLLDDYELLAP